LRNHNILIAKQITTMATRNGKVANLPNDIREQLNLRLLEGETGKELAAWLNALPTVQSVLGSQFNGAPISEVNLTYWRQGGYLQWLTARECFDSARALADGDCNLAGAGLNAERLLNILTLRFGQLLMSWNSVFDENTSQTVAFSETARKARILQGISRSVLAIHRIQSHSASSKAEGEGSSLSSPGRSSTPSAPSKANGKALVSPACTEEKPRLEPDLDADALRVFRAPLGGAAARPEILLGPISPSNIPLKRSRAPFKIHADLAEVLNLV
jgi:hypothetical protein